MDPKAPPEMLRPLRLLLTAESIRLMDECVYRGLAGYTSRHDFVRDAIENHALDLLYPEGAEAEDVPRARTRRSKTSPAVKSSNGSSHMESPGAPVVLDAVKPVDASETALVVPPNVTTVENELARVRHEPLIGLHNRDWPSLWALSDLAVHTVDGPRPLREVYAETTKAAWDLGVTLRHLEQRDGTKLTPLLPTNSEKPQSAEAGFQAFAIGAVARRPASDGSYEASGPLYLWDALALVPGENGPLLGVTPHGLRLLKLMEGLTVTPPLATKKAETFFEYLRKSAPDDWAGFRLLLETIADGAGRLDLAERFVAMRDWSESVGSSTAQGYLGRGREWGLVLPKLVDGCYRLTEFGERLMEATAGNQKGERRGRSSAASAGRAKRSRSDKEQAHA